MPHQNTSVSVARATPRPGAQETVSQNVPGTPPGAGQHRARQPATMRSAVETRKTMSSSQALRQDLMRGCRVLSP